MARSGKPTRRRSVRPEAFDTPEEKAARSGWVAKLIQAFFVLAALVLCVAALVVLWPETEASFRPRMAEYRQALDAPAKGKLTDEDRGGRILILDADAAKIDPVQTDLPDKLRARSPKDVKFVARVKWKSQAVGVYRSKSGSSATALRWDCDVEVRHLASGRGTQITVRGEDPPGFTGRYKASQGGGTKPVFQVIEYLTALVQKP